ncbi:MAG: TatD family hydrolase [Burkholderiales bacterium]|nr:TatD family hydrolase [Burkholderiales bacterium]
MFVDSHCHLSFPGLRERLPEVLQDMHAAQVRAALVICTTIEEFAEVRAIAASAPNLWASVGVHPDNENVHEPDAEELLHLAHQDKRVVAIGETGLDYYRLNGRSVADMDWQRERFRTHIRAAAAADLPLVIHTRSASQDTLDILREEGQGRVRGVFHCFTETVAVARAALDLGCHVSLSGIVTFRNAGELREVARMLPLDRLLIETDSPYLAPVPHRGKPNTPAYVPLVAAEIARERGVPLEQIAEASTRNFERLFRVQIPREAA